MQWNDNTKTLELTARNVAALTGKLDDPLSARMLQSGCGRVLVHAVEDAADPATAAAAEENVVILSRGQLGVLADEGASISVASVTVTSVPDAAHYSDRPAGAVVMPSSGEVLAPDTSHWRLRHICEVCGADEVLTPDEAFDAGWDYPPRIGPFGVVGPRTCGRCGINKTVWWALAVDHCTVDMLTPAQHDTIARITGEPQSIAAPDA